MVDVVISYGRAQEAMAGRVAGALEADGYEVWWDHNIPAHAAYGKLIEEKFTAAKAVLVIWSETAAQSEWVRAEADLARSQHKLIQVSVDGTTPPLPFSQIQFVPLVTWDGTPAHPEWRRVRASLQALCGDGAQPSPAPGPRPSPPSPPAPPPAPPRRGLPVALAAVGVVVAGAIGFAVARQSPQGPASATLPPAQPAAPAAPVPGPGPSPPAPSPPPASDADFVLPQSSSRRLTEADLGACANQAQSLRLARNEIYARHGRTFKSQDLNAYFNQFAWYRPVGDAVSLSKVEQANVDFLQQAEAAARNAPDQTVSDQAVPKCS